MRIIKYLTFTFFMFLALSALSADKGVQVDLLTVKIKSALDAGRYGNAVSYFTELEALAPLSDDNLFLYINTLERAGERQAAYKRANDYLERYGNNGRHYQKALEVVGRLGEQFDSEKKNAERSRAFEECSNNCIESRDDWCRDKVRYKMRNPQEIQISIDKPFEWQVNYCKQYSCATWGYDCECWKKCKAQYDKGS